MILNRTLLFITTRLFWPADSGRKVVLWNYCKGLANQCGYNVYLYSFLEGGQEPSLVNDAPEFIKGIRLAEEDNIISKTTRILSALFIDRKYPLQCALYCNKKNSKLISEYVSELQPDVIIVDMLRLAPYIESFKECPAAKIINFDDLLSKRYSRQCEEGSNEAPVLGRYADKAPRSLISAMGLRKVRNAGLRSESKRALSAEERYSKEYDASLLISPVEAEELKKKIKSKSVFVATMGAETHPYAPESSRCIKYDFAFVGNMSYAPNQDSLAYIANEVLLNINPQPSLRVIGVCPESVRNRYAASDSITFSGRVESIREALLECKVMLAPIAYGSGIKTKVLEAMGMGIPVITNSVGAEGLVVSSGTECIIENDPKSIAREAIKLLASRDERERLGRSGLSYVRRAHSWISSIDELDRCINYAIKIEEARNSD